MSALILQSGRGLTGPGPCRCLAEEQLPCPGLGSTQLQPSTCQL